MRLVRLGALLGSLMLLVATTVSLINQRSELYSEQDARVVSAELIAETSAAMTVERARAVVEVADAEMSPEVLLRSFGPQARACVDRRCSGADLAQLDQFGVAAGASAAEGGRAVAVVDVISDSVLVVGRNAATVGIQLPLDEVVGALPTSIEQDAVAIDVSASRSQAQDSLGIDTVDGRRVFQAVVAEPFESGSLVVTASVAEGVGLGADSPGLYAALLALGTVLLVLAGWTFLVDRRQLEERATTDELTGLVNRREFERQSEEQLDMAGRLGAGLCLMLIDLNDFKQINDTLGHQFGDQVLKACAARLRDAVRDTDLVGRWGGDEFVVLLPGLVEAGAVRNSAERIGASLSSSPVADGVSISGSVGAALYPRHGHDLDELMQAADVAMYEAKTTGVLHRLAETIPSGASIHEPGYGGPERRRTIAVADRRDQTRTNRPGP